MDKIKLFCIPYAGGSAVVYRDWEKHLHRFVELHSIELAGRGSRFGAPFYRSIDEAVNDIYELISPELDGCRYAVFGHSMGGLLAYELAFKLKSLNYDPPAHIFISGKRPPQIETNNKKFHLLPDKEFMNEIIQLGGTPSELLQNKELLEIYIPILKADFKIIEKHGYLEKDDKLDCDITVLWGKQEENTTLSEICDWRGHTDKNCKIHLFNGGHFFINDFTSDVVNIINTQLGLC